VLSKFPEWWRSNKFQPPTATDGLFQYAFRQFTDFFDYLSKSPPHDDYFNKFMSGYHQGRPSWMDVGFYPVQQLIDGLDAADPEAVLLVDIGGNVGHDIDEFRRKSPDAPGRLILQDLPQVIDRITSLDARIERMPHDFLAEQPIKGKQPKPCHDVYISTC
jgi:hypothetical protein